MIVGGTSVSSTDVCAPIKARFGGKSGRAERRWRRMQRQQALDFLNLHCSSLNLAARLTVRAEGGCVPSGHDR